MKPFTAATTRWQAKHEDTDTQRSRQREERGFNAGEFENGKAQ